MCCPSYGQTPPFLAPVLSHLRPLIGISVSSLVQMGTATISVATCTKRGTCLQWTRTLFPVGGRSEESRGQGSGAGNRTTGNRAQGFSCRRGAVFAGFLEVAAVARATVASWLSGGLLDSSSGFGFTGHPLLKAPLALAPRIPSLLGLLQPPTTLPAATQVLYCPRNLMLPRVSVSSSLGTGVPPPSSFSDHSC